LDQYFRGPEDDSERVETCRPKSILWWGNRRERDHWGELGVDGWIILGWIFRRWDVGIWTGLGWPRIEIAGGRL